LYSDLVLLHKFSFQIIDEINIQIQYHWHNFTNKKVFKIFKLSGLLKQFASLNLVFVNLNLFFVNLNLVFVNLNQVFFVNLNLVCQFELSFCFKSKISWDVSSSMYNPMKYLPCNHNILTKYAKTEGKVGAYIRRWVCLYLFNYFKKWISII
jgi:hypothetical protein